MAAVGAVLLGHHPFPSSFARFFFVFRVLSPPSSVSVRVCVLFLVGLALLPQRTRIIARLTWSLSPSPPSPHLPPSYTCSPFLRVCVCVRQSVAKAIQRAAKHRSRIGNKKRNKKMRHANRFMRQNTGTCREKARRWRSDLLFEAPQRKNRRSDADSASVMPN